MDLLYQRYSNPLELVKLYISNGRFGDFVKGFFEIKQKEDNEKAIKENEDKLWELYLHSMPTQSFAEWKSKVLNNKESIDTNGSKLSMTDKEIDNEKKKARNILKNFSL